jgi:hypothetical protein
MKLKPGFKAILILAIVGAAGFGINVAMEKGLLKAKPAEVVEVTATPVQATPDVEVTVSVPAPTVNQTSAPAVNAGLANLLQAKKH